MLQQVPPCFPPFALKPSEPLSGRHRADRRARIRTFRLTGLMETSGKPKPKIPQREPANVLIPTYPYFLCILPQRKREKQTQRSRQNTQARCRFSLDSYQQTCGNSTAYALLATTHPSLLVGTAVIREVAFQSVQGRKTMETVHVRSSNHYLRD